MFLVLNIAENFQLLYVLRLSKIFLPFALGPDLFCAGTLALVLRLIVFLALGCKVNFATLLEIFCLCSKSSKKFIVLLQFLNLFFFLRLDAIETLINI